MIKIYFRQEKAGKIRKEGKVPGILYGPNIGNKTIYALEKDINDLYKNHEGGIFEFEFENKKLLGILREVQFHPLTDKIIHFDIYLPSFERKVITKIPIEFIGEAPVLKAGGVLNFGLQELEIEALPQDLPEKIIVDLSSLKEIGQTIYVRDLNLSSKIKILVERDTPIVTAIKEAEEKITEESTLLSSETTNA